MARIWIHRKSGGGNNDRDRRIGDHHRQGWNGAHPEADDADHCPKDGGQPEPGEYAAGVSPLEPSDHDPQRRRAGSATPSAED